jgi:hypothetical protein
MSLTGKDRSFLNGWKGKNKNAPTGAIPNRGALRPNRLRLRNYFHIGGLWAFLALGHFEFDRISLFEGLIAFSGDGGKVDKHVGFSIVPGDKSITLAAIKPFYFAFYHFASPFYVLVLPMTHCHSAVGIKKAASIRKNAAY